ncbi:SDR family NAD(P)-dependent oxidoreductase [Rhodococcus qingshengii]|jgi:NAD(P)-dependent dehydrogenase (short-subunit alcohol dehydrogenase family)|uniref:SDR family NAD(P)-dependent oxidoreductase n=1 Tax=Streptomyces sp. NPDC014791 TaxID=3364912 RepID=UPI0001A2170B|nr:SDR family NAD(P)-dependent oxidoreductase [Rhodococcus qingshengii]EEN84297.1 putative 3-hydroxybutyrate dehydrogenase [Rhodococcus erythropolis SK121]MCZ4548128.1 SDR family NAD(P)-dependent oxidoreductase [Rhodococcus qingshengii]
MNRLAGKKIVITGAASGIGRAAAELMVTEGASVLIADLDGDAASNTAAETSRSEVGDRAVGIAVDVMDENQ